MSYIIGRFGAVDIIRLFLHGIFAIYPLAFFPEIINLVGPAGLALLTIVAGMVLYASPAERLIPSYDKYYMKGLNSHVASAVGLKDVSNVRSLYDVFFYGKLSETVRYRVHWLVSLYFFYSRTYIVTLVHGIVFSTAIIYLFLQLPANMSIVIVPSESVGVLLEKSFLLVLLSFIVMILSFKQSSKVIRQVSDFEKSLIDYYAADIRQIAKTSGYLDESNPSTSIAPPTNS